MPAGKAAPPGLLTALGIVLVVTACGSTGPDRPPDDPGAEIEPAMSLVTVDRPLLLAGDTVQVTLQARDAAGQPLTFDGATVAFSSQGGSSLGAFLPVVDHHNGTYSANFVGASPGTALTIAAHVNGHAITSTLPTLRVVGFTRIVVAGGTQVGAQTTTGGFTCGIITTGDMHCWGISWFGIRGNGTTGSTQPGLEPTLVGGGHLWTDVAAGNYFLCAVAVDGIIYCWGDGDVGQLGDGLSGSPPDVTVPAPVSGSDNFRAVSIGMSGGTCALTLGDTAMCWGAGTWGRLGNGSETLSAVPVAANGGLAFDALSTAHSGTCGVAAGSAYCWGYSTLLGLGGAPAPDTCAGSVPCAKAPITVSGGHGFRPIIALDGNVACAVATDDQTYCWGSGYLGNGTADTSSTPTVVSGGFSFTSLAAGDGYHCGTVAGGAAYCWGANKNGRLGNGTTTDALVPTAVSGGHAFVQISAGQDHTCGAATDGNAYCWGGNDKGELGTRSQSASLTPVRVRLFAP
jgi:hypothetical protein